MLGTPELYVKNGVTRIFYPSGGIYEGEVRERKRYALECAHVVLQRLAH